MRTGCAWRQLPRDVAPWSTVCWYFTWWHDDGSVEHIHDALRDQVRTADGRNAEPTAGLIDSPSVRTADTVPVATRGFDAGKKIWADQGFAGRLVDRTTQIIGRELDIVRKDPGRRGFQVRPKRWAVERTASSRGSPTTGASHGTTRPARPTRRR
ncbi:transposase [Streptomyces sp. NPDC048277]|uniref:transposase n=1 Tax=Streptomyces sp. NPDC048277 TaxID=3155027 RepID=UPI0033E4B3D8